MGISTVSYKVSIPEYDEVFIDYLEYRVLIKTPNIMWNVLWDYVGKYVICSDSEGNYCRICSDILDSEQINMRVVLLALGYTNFEAYSIVPVRLIDKNMSKQELLEVPLYKCNIFQIEIKDL